MKYIMAKSLFSLFLSKDNNVKNTIFLGLSDDPAKLYVDGLNPQTAYKKHKSIILKWLTLVETELDDLEKKDMEYAFTCNPLTEFHYPIKDMTLYIIKIKIH
jgi:hypothetical protein